MQSVKQQNVVGFKKSLYSPKKPLQNGSQTEMQEQKVLHKVVLDTEARAAYMLCPRATHLSPKFLQ